MQEISSMQQKGFRHYHRKKALYRFFMMRSPRTGGIFGLSWMLMAIELFPFFLFSGFRIFCVSKGSWQFPAVIGGSVFLLIFLYLFGMIFCAQGLYGCLRSILKKKTVLRSILASAGALFPQIMGLILLPVLICKKRITAALFAFAGAVLYAMNLRTDWPPLFFLTATVCYLAAFAGIWDKAGSPPRFALTPLWIAIAANLVLFGWDLKLQSDIRMERSRLSRIIGQSVELEDFWARETKGFPADREPLKTLIAHNPEDMAIGMKKHYSPAEANAELTALQKRHPLFLKAIDDFLKLPAEKISHRKPEDGLATSIEIPELQPLCNAVRVLALRIAADPGNKRNTAECNRMMLKVRNIVSQNHFLISHLAAIAVESIRLDAISALLPGGEYTKEEFVGLVGEPVDWDQSLRLAYGEESAHFCTVLEFFLRGDCLSSLKAVGFIHAERCKSVDLPYVNRTMPLFLHVQFRRDYLFALRTYIKACSVPQTLSGIEKSELAKEDRKELDRDLYFLSAMLIPALNYVFVRNAMIVNSRQAALAAAEIMEYRKQLGELPADLSFLPKIPVSELDHKPFLYEKLPDGFRIFTLTEKGKRPAENDTRYSLRIRLNE